MTHAEQIVERDKPIAVHAVSGAFWTVMFVLAHMDKQWREKNVRAIMFDRRATPRYSPRYAQIGRDAHRDARRDTRRAKRRPRARSCPPKPDERAFAGWMAWFLRVKLGLPPRRHSNNAVACHV